MFTNYYDLLEGCSVKDGTNKDEDQEALDILLDFFRTFRIRSPEEITSITHIQMERHRED